MSTTTATTPAPAIEQSLRLSAAPRCRHCLARPWTGQCRGLCPICWSTPSIRALYPAWKPWAGEVSQLPEMPPGPIDRPLTRLERMGVLAARVAREWPTNDSQDVCEMILPPHEHPGPLVRRLRERAGISRKALSRMLGHTHTYIGNLEAGRFRPDEKTIAWIREVLEGPAALGGA